MSHPTSPFLRARRFLVALFVGSGIVLSGQAIYVQASAADIEWVDGGDDSPCLNDDKGRALDSLPVDKFCTPIPGCYQDDDGKWVLPSRKTGIWQGNPADVKYADEIKATPAPTTPKPTTPKPSTPTKTKAPSTGGGNGNNNSGNGGTTNGGTTTPVAGAPAGAPAAETAAPTAPTAPDAPTVTVKGSDVTVSWTPSPNAALESVTGYVVQFTDADPVQVDAAITTHTFTDLDDGNYRAAVQAVNASGPSLTSLPSEIATIGTPIAEVVGTLAVDGDLEPGGTITVTGTGFAKDVPELALELHSDPVALGTVATDDKGAFTSTVTIPQTVEEGDHSVVVLYDGTEITSAPVAVAAVVDDAAAATTETAAVAETVPPVAGLAILAALGLAGIGSLVWHVATGRRRRDRTRANDLLGAPTDLVGARPLAASAPGVS